MILASHKTAQSHEKKQPRSAAFDMESSLFVLECNTNYIAFKGYR
jgi:hypothetical protein